MCPRPPLPVFDRSPLPAAPTARARHATDGRAGRVPDVSKRATNLARPAADLLQLGSLIPPLENTTAVDAGRVSGTPGTHG